MVATINERNSREEALPVTNAAATSQKQSRGQSELAVAEGGVTRAAWCNYIWAKVASTVSVSRS